MLYLRDIYSPLVTGHGGGSMSLMACEEVTLGPSMSLPLAFTFMEWVFIQMETFCFTHNLQSVFLPYNTVTYVTCTLSLPCPLLVGRAGGPDSGVQVIIWDK